MLPFCCKILRKRLEHLYSELQTKSAGKKVSGTIMSVTETKMPSNDLSKLKLTKN